MKRDKRKFKITYNRYDVECLFHYKGKQIALPCGHDDLIHVFRYGDDFFILAIHELLGYAGFSLISKDCEIIQEEFIQDVQSIFEDDRKKKDFFKYTPNYQADFLGQWIYIG